MRRLLEQAAKAAGFIYNPTVVSNVSLSGCFTDDTSQHLYLWLPQDSNAQALDLAGRLFMRLDIGHASVIARWVDEELSETLEHYEYYDTPAQRSRAVRLAVLRLAAKVGDRK